MFGQTNTEGSGRVGGGGGGGGLPQRGAKGGGKVSEKRLCRPDSRSELTASRMGVPMHLMQEWCVCRILQGGCQRVTARQHTHTNTHTVPQQKMQAHHRIGQASLCVLPLAPHVLKLLAQLLRLGNAASVCEARTQAPQTSLARTPAAGLTEPLSHGAASVVAGAAAARDQTIIGRENATSEPL